MRRLLLNEYGKLPSHVGSMKPELIPDHYLIKIAHAPINPSDLFFMTGNYAIKK